MTVLDRKLITRMVNPQPGGNGGGGGAGGAGAYVLPAASNSELGGIKLGYPTGTGKYYPVQLDDQQRAYVNVPWTDHHAWDDITDKPATATRWPSFDEVTSKPATATRWPSWDEVTSKPSFNYIPLHNIKSTNGNIPTWGTLTAANGYSAGAIWSFPGGSDLAFAYKSGQVSMQVDGFFYQNEGSYKVCDVGGFAMNSGARISFSGGNGYIGNANNAGWLLVQDICSQNGAGDTYWSLRTDGTAHFTNVYVNKGVAEDTWSSKSDARLKNVLGDVNLTVEQIAAMPAVRFTWKSRAPHQVHVGTLAQDIQKVLPEVVGKTDGDILTVAYAEAAFVSVVKVAQRVLELEKLIKHGTHQ